MFATSPSEASSPREILAEAFHVCRSAPFHDTAEALGLRNNGWRDPTPSAAAQVRDAYALLRLSPEGGVQHRSAVDILRIFQVERDLQTRYPRLDVDAEMGAQTLVKGSDPEVVLSFRDRATERDTSRYCLLTAKGAGTLEMAEAILAYLPKQLELGLVTMGGTHDLESCSGNSSRTDKLDLYYVHPSLSWLAVAGRPETDLVVYVSVAARKNCNLHKQVLQTRFGNE